MKQVVHVPSLSDAAMATAELILSIQAEYPGVKLKPLPPLSDDIISLEVWLPISHQQLLSAQHRIAQLQGEVWDKYGVFTVAMAIPLEDNSNTNPTSDDGGESE